MWGCNFPVSVVQSIPNATFPQKGPMRPGCRITNLFLHDFSHFFDARRDNSCYHMNTPSPGLTFTMYLPSARLRQESALKHYTWNQSQKGWLMVRVLVVDGEALIRDVLTQWLQSWGYDALAVAAADEALEYMQTSPAEIVIADAAMPEHDILWLLHQLRERWPDTLVIMESGADDLETALRTRLQGAFDHVPKPLAHETLHQTLERARTAIRPPQNLNGQLPPANGSNTPTES